MGIEIDFSKLDGMDVLDLAGFFEREAAETCEQLASWAKSNSPEAEAMMKESSYRDPWDLKKFA